MRKAALPGEPLFFRSPFTVPGSELKAEPGTLNSELGTGLEIEQEG